MSYGQAQNGQTCSKPESQEHGQRIELQLTVVPFPYVALSLFALFYAGTVWPVVDPPSTGGTVVGPFCSVSV